MCVCVCVCEEEEVFPRVGLRVCVYVGGAHCGGDKR